MPETYNPGQRKRQFGQNHKLSEGRAAWVICENGKFLIIAGEDKGSGQDIVVLIPRPGKIPDTTIHLSNLTEPELNALQELFTSAFDWARPVVRQRDEEARNAWENGDDSYSRSYRPLPTVVYRKRKEPEHSQGVPERPEGVPEGGGGERSDYPGGVRGVSDELAQLDETSGISEDDCTQTD